MIFLIFALNPFFVLNRAHPGESGILSSTPFSSVIQQIKGSERNEPQISCAQAAGREPLEHARTLPAPRSHLCGGAGAACPSRSRSAAPPRLRADETVPGITKGRPLPRGAIPCLLESQGFLDPGSLAAVLS